MPQRAIARVKLTAAARSDILSITAYGIETFGEAQAHLYQDEMFRQFELLAEYPRPGQALEGLHSYMRSLGTSS